MRKFIPAESELQSLKEKADCLKKFNAVQAETKKTIEATKAFFAKWLKDNRGLDLETLPIGEIVVIEGVVMIEMGKMDKFDEKAFLLEHADLHATFKRPLPVTKYKPLV